jgi:hypothetical protein
VGRACSTNGGEGECILDFVGKARRKVGRTTHRWEEDNIRVDII